MIRNHHSYIGEIFWGLFFFSQTAICLVQLEGFVRNQTFVDRDVREPTELRSGDVPVRRGTWYIVIYVNFSTYTSGNQENRRIISTK